MKKATGIIPLSLPGSRSRKKERNESEESYELNWLQALSRSLQRSLLYHTTCKRESENQI